MAKQMAAFLGLGRDTPESRHPKMVDVTLSNETHVDIIAGGDDKDYLDISDLSNISPVLDVTNRLNSLVKKPSERLGESDWEPLMVIDSLPDDKSSDTSAATKLVKVPDVGKIDSKVSNSWKPSNHERD